MFKAYQEFQKQKSSLYYWHTILEMTSTRFHGNQDNWERGSHFEKNLMKIKKCGSLRGVYWSAWTGSFPYPCAFVCLFACLLDYEMPFVH